MKEGLEALNAITEVVLAYRPPNKKKKARAKKRVASKTRK
jgi:hypothetical protein